jgi:hypothetical protein
MADTACQGEVRKQDPTTSLFTTTLRLIKAAQKM